MFRFLFLLVFLFVSLNAKENSFINQTSNSEKWQAYYEKTLDVTKPQYTLFLAQRYFELEGKVTGLAIDLGAGTGKDTLFLLNKGWKVKALDSEPIALDIILHRTPAEQLHQFEVEINSFATMQLPQAKLINASYSLPFCEPEAFQACWEHITDQLVVGGRFAGQFFGIRDEWATNPYQTFHTEEQIHQLFKNNFEIEYLQIEEGKLPTAAGPMKHWHVFHVVAKKIH